MSAPKSNESRNHGATLFEHVTKYAHPRGVDFDKEIGGYPNSVRVQISPTSHIVEFCRSRHDISSENSQDAVYLDLAYIRLLKQNGELKRSVVLNPVLINELEAAYVTKVNPVMIK